VNDSRGEDSNVKSQKDRIMIGNSDFSLQPGARRAAARLLRASFALALVAPGAGLLSAQSAENLRLTVGKSVVIDYPSDVRQISTSNPDVIDANPVTTREILMHGKGLGAATLVVWSKTGQRTFYNVNVELNLDPLRRLLRETFPKETVTLYSERDSVTLNGTVSNKEVADRMAALAAGFTKAVVNNLQVREGPIQKQILLRVRFAELDRAKEEQFGVNLLAAPGNNAIGSTTQQFNPPLFSGTLTIPPTANGGSTSSSGSASSSAGGTNTGGTSTSSTANSGIFSISQVLNLFALDPHLNLGAFIKALQNENILQVLAEPNLVTSDGKEANFLVGGEFPVPVLQGGANSGAVTVQFREFGIRLNFTPQITGNNTIRMSLRQEVSTLDYTNAVSINGFTIPALSNRRAETTVELGDGQSFVVAGLVNNQERNTLSKIPMLANLPILGALFKSKDEVQQRQELIMIVTPEITTPLGPNDPKPDLYFPKKFLVRLTPDDVSKDAKNDGKSRHK
jgi:pilus assembly protein CpaC